MPNRQLTPLLEAGELLKFQTLDRFATVFGKEPRRISDEQLAYAFLFVKQGNGHCFIDNVYVPLQQGTLLFVNPFCFLHLENTLYIQGVVILFTEEFFCRFPLHEQLLYKAIYSPHRRLFFQLSENETGSKYLLSQITTFGWEYRFGTDPLLKFDFLHNMLLGMVIYLHKLQLESENAYLDLIERYAKSQIVQFIRLLNEHFREHSNLQFYADQMNITQDQLATVCKKGIGWSPKAMMQEKLLRESKRLLLFENMSVKEISYHLGFTEPTNFVKFFQQHTGISPKNFKVEHCIKGLDKQNDVA